MLRKVNLKVLLGIVVAAILSFGLVGAAQEEEGDDARGVKLEDDSAGAVAGGGTGEALEEFGQLQSEVQAAQGARNDAAEETRQAADDLVDTQNKLAVAKEGTAEAQGELADEVSKTYRNGELDGLLGVMLGAESVADLTNRLEYATRVLTQRRDAVEEAEKAEEELDVERQKRQEKLQEYQEADLARANAEEEAERALSVAEDYRDALPEDVREEVEDGWEEAGQYSHEEVEAERALWAEQDSQIDSIQASGAEIMREIEQNEPMAVRQEASAIQTAAEKIAELRDTEQKTKEEAAEKVKEAEQASLAVDQKAEPGIEEQQDTGEATAFEAEQQAAAEAEQAATEAARQAEAAEQARNVAERSVAANRAGDQAAMKEAKKTGQIEVADDADGVVNGGDKLRVEGDFSISPGASVTIQDADGTRGTAIDDVNAEIVEGSIDATLMGPLDNVTGGDGMLDTGSLEVVDTTGISTGLEGASQDAIGAGGLQDAPDLGVPDLGVPDLGVPDLGVPDLGIPDLGVPNLGAPKLGDMGSGRNPAASGQRGLQRSSAAPVAGSASGAAALAVGAQQLGKPYAWGTDGPNVFSCTGLMRYILKNIGVDADAPWEPTAYLGQYPGVDGPPAPGDIVVMANPDGVGMYAGGGQVLIANEFTGVVGYTSIEFLDVSGIVRPPYK